MLEIKISFGEILNVILNQITNFLPQKHEHTKYHKIKGKNEEGLRLDVLVENQVICELNAIETVNPVWEAQILSHLKFTITGLE
jgi:GxxExxY protein